MQRADGVSSLFLWRSLMKKRLITMLLALLMVMGLLPTAAFAASTPEEALGEIDIYSGGEELSYLSINGRVRTLIYTYYNYDNGSGVSREIPAYCVNPNTTGVPQTVSAGESIEYLADERASDPKVVGIVANGYPTRTLKGHWHCCQRLSDSQPGGTGPGEQVPGLLCHKNGALVLPPE